MRAGELNHRITVQNYTAVVDPNTGYREQTWADFASMWADVRHLSGTSVIAGGAEHSKVQASARIRWREDITPAMRVVYNGKEYAIEAILPGHKREHVDLLLKLVI